MKKMHLAFLSMLIIALIGASCKRDEIAPGIQTENKKAPVGTSAQRVIQDCFYTTLTETSPGIWEGSFSGTTVKFVNLHIRADGKLYGRIISAGSNTVLLTGDEGYNQRDFAFEQVVCGGGGGVTKTTTNVSYTQFTSMSAGNSSYAYYGGTFSSGTAFNLWAQSNLVAGITYHVSTGTYQEIHYQWNTPMNCNNTQVVLGKLVAKGVVQTSPGGPFTWTEFGISNMCYPDPLVMLLDY